MTSTTHKLKLRTFIIFSFIFTLALTPNAKSLELLGYWDFNDPSDAAVASDISGNSPDLEFIGSAAYTENGDGLSDSAGDYALDLGGVNDGSLAQTIEGEHLSTAVENNAMSVVFWQNTTATGNTSSFWIHSPAAGSNDRGFQAHTPWGNGTIYFDQSGCCGPAQRLTIGGLVQLEQWQHFVFQRDAEGNMEIWVDGVQQATQGGAEPLDEFNGIITIGAEGPTQANSFAGRIDDFAIFNNVLNEEQITSLAEGSTPLSLVAPPAENIISFVGPLTDDASTGISPDNEYTHTISGGGVESVNGVEFELLDANTTPDNFFWDVSSVKNQINDNNGSWD
ncbi:MAG: LamG domain-containing protein, partial [Verrucomicrobiales bacterium]